MKNFRMFILLTLILSSAESFSQAKTEVEMADLLRQDGKIYTVVLGLVIILTGMILFLVRVDRKIFHLEKQIKQGK